MLGPRARNAARRILPALVSALALGWVATRFDMGRVLDALSWRVLLVLGPALIAYGACTLLLESLSMLRLVDRRPEGFGAWTAARIKCASYLLGIVNYALGAAALSVLLRRRAQLPLGGAASVVLLISLTDLMVVLGLGATALALAPARDSALRIGVVTVAGIGFFGGMALLRAPGSLGPLERIRSLTVFDALRRTPLRRLGELALLRLVFSLCFVAVAGAAFAAFGLEIALPHLVAGVMVLALVGAIPIAVAGLGTGQIVAVRVFSGVATPETLIAVSLVLSAGLIALRAGMGALFAREFTREALAETRSEAA